MQPIPCSRGVRMHVTLQSGGCSTVKCQAIIIRIAGKHDIIHNNVLQHRQRRTKTQPSATCTENVVKFGRVVPEICSYRRIYRHAHYNTPLFSYQGRVTMGTGTRQLTQFKSCIFPRESEDKWQSPLSDHAWQPERHAKILYNLDQIANL